MPRQHASTLDLRTKRTLKLPRHQRSSFNHVDIEDLYDSTNLLLFSSSKYNYTRGFIDEVDKLDDYYSQAHNTSYDFGVSNFTVELETRRIATSDNYYPLLGTSNQNLSGGGWSLGVRSTGSFYFRCHNGSTVEINSPPFTDLIRKYKVTVVRFNNALTMYVDGVYQISTPLSGSLTAYNPTTATLYPPKVLIIYDVGFYGFLVSWLASTYVTTYQVQTSLDDAFSALTGDVTTTNTHTILTGLLPGRSHYVRIRATGPTLSDWSRTYLVNTDGQTQGGSLTGGFGLHPLFGGSLDGGYNMVGQVRAGGDWLNCTTQRYLSGGDDLDGLIQHPFAGGTVLGGYSMLGNNAYGGDWFDATLHRQHLGGDYLNASLMHGIPHNGGSLAGGGYLFGNYGYGGELCNGASAYQKNGGELCSGWMLVGIYYIGGDQAGALFQRQVLGGALVGGYVATPYQGGALSGGYALYGNLAVNQDCIGGYLNRVPGGGCLVGGVARARHSGGPAVGGLCVPGNLGVDQDWSGGSAGRLVYGGDAIDGTFGVPGFGGDLLGGWLYEAHSGGEITSAPYLTYQPGGALVGGYYLEALAQVGGTVMGGYLTTYKPGGDQTGAEAQSIETGGELTGGTIIPITSTAWTDITSPLWDNMIEPYWQAIT